MSAASSRSARGACSAYDEHRFKEDPCVLLAQWERLIGKRGNATRRDQPIAHDPRLLVEAVEPREDHDPVHNEDSTGVTAVKSEREKWFEPSRDLHASVDVAE